MGTDLEHTLFIPSNMLRMGEEIFLDDMSLDEVSTSLGMHVVPIESTGKAFIEAILNENYHMKRNNESVGYIKAYAENEEESL